MTQHDDRITLRQMLDHAVEIIDFSAGRGVVDFSTDRLWSLAIVRLLSIVGEAATRLPEETRLKLSQIPWRSIIDFRNRIVHGYDAIDFDRVWHIIHSELPTLVHELELLQLPEFD